MRVPKGVSDIKKQKTNAIKSMLLVIFEISKTLITTKAIQYMENNSFLGFL